MTKFLSHLAGRGSLSSHFLRLPHVGTGLVFFGGDIKKNYCTVGLFTHSVYRYNVKDRYFYRKLWNRQVIPVIPNLLPAPLTRECLLSRHLSSPFRLWLFRLPSPLPSSLLLLLLPRVQNRCPQPETQKLPKI